MPNCLKSPKLNLEALCTGQAMIFHYLNDDSLFSHVRGTRKSIRIQRNLIFGPGFLRTYKPHNPHLKMRTPMRVSLCTLLWLHSYYTPCLPYPFQICFIHEDIHQAASIMCVVSTSNLGSDGLGNKLLSWQRLVWIPFFALRLLDPLLDVGPLGSPGYPERRRVILV